MNFCTTSFINTMYKLDLFVHMVPSSRTLNMVHILSRNFRMDFDFFSLAASHMITSGASIYFANYFTACRTLDLDIIGMT